MAFSIDVAHILGCRGSSKKSGKPYIRNTFTKEEDEILRTYVNRFGTSNWQLISEHVPGRNARQCKERWFNYLAPEIENGPWSPEEDALLQEKYKEIGPRWTQIAKYFPSRSDVNVKNRWRFLARAERRKIRQTMKLMKKMPRKTKQPKTVPEEREFTFNFDDFDDFDTFHEAQLD